MGWGESDVYYNPEDYGLTVVAAIEWADESWEFDMTVVWQDANGQFYIADDSGCSCPSPFEDFTKIDDLNKVSKFEAAEWLKERAEAQKPDIKYTRSTPTNYDRVNGEVVDAIAKIMKLGV